MFLIVKLFHSVFWNMVQSAGVALSRLVRTNVAEKCRNMSQVLFGKYLLITNVGISASLSFAGDFIQQSYEILHNNKDKWDRIRTFQMSLSGVTVGIICHHWYNILDAKLPGKTFQVVVKKVVLDQLICSPICITIFFVTTCYLENASLKQTVDQIVEKGWRLYLADWLIWPPAQLFNFYFLPTRYRVLYDNTVSLGFDIYFSYIKHEVPMKGDNASLGTS